MSSTPTAIAQQALDAAGINFELGDVEDGSHEARVCLRAYWQCRRQLLRGAQWDFARKQTPLVLLADGTGQTPNVGTVVHGQFNFEYEYPRDCVRVRYIPWNHHQMGSPPPAGNIQIPPNVPQTTVPNTPAHRGLPHPARFLVTSDPNFPAAPGSDWEQVQGVSPVGSTVILTNVQNAQIVYTYDVIYPTMWDPLFRMALVAYLASEIALPLSKDKRLALTLRDRQIQIAKEKLSQARALDGQEGWHSSDIAVDWMLGRRALGGRGGGWGEGFGGGGDLGGFFGGCGWDSIGFSNGSAY